MGEAASFKRFGNPESAVAAGDRKLDQSRGIPQPVFAGYSPGPPDLQNLEQVIAAVAPAWKAEQEQVNWDG